MSAIAAGSSTVRCAFVMAVRMLRFGATGQAVNAGVYAIGVDQALTQRVFHNSQLDKIALKYLIFLATRQDLNLRPPD
jgi:hypothetical protein